MSLLARLARHAHPAGSCRAYPSFFSSKPGGGRHFDSAKSPKPVLQPGRAKVDNTTPTGSPDESAATSPPSTARVVDAAPPQDKLSSKPAETHSQPQSHTTLPPSSSVAPPFIYHAPVHPTISSKDYKLHQFLSLHRPLLLLDQPTSTIFEAADPSTPLFTSSEHEVNSGLSSSFATIDNPPESSPEADLDAARQLAHALVSNQVGGAIAWQQALTRLGLSAESNMTLAEKTAQEWVTIHADSTRRKKRKKMKKHKLKKRRRLTRRQDK